jgi:hypothetical protein
MNGLYWETEEYVYRPKNREWFWAVGIITGALIVTCIIFSNYLFAFVLAIGVFALTLFSIRKPNKIVVHVTNKGVLVNNILYPYQTLDSFGTDEHHQDGPRLFLKSKKVMMPLINISISEHDPEDVRAFLAQRLKEEHFDLGILHSLLERAGF